MVGAGFSWVHDLCVVIVVGSAEAEEAVVMFTVVVVVVEVVVVVGVSVVFTGSATVASMVSRIISVPPSSDSFSVMCCTALAEWSGKEESKCRVKERLDAHTLKPLPKALRG